MYVNQAIMPYAFNLRSDARQLFLNKTGKRYQTSFFQVKEQLM